VAKFFENTIEDTSRYHILDFSKKTLDLSCDIGINFAYANNLS